ncbi:O-acyltransferase [Aphelenchoides besseyi]|nr:O-acyltransferase [Aphelenchoides besseyi]
MSKDEGARKRRSSHVSNYSSPTATAQHQTPINKQGIAKTDAPDRPVHTAQDSLFSSSSGWTNYRGFFNLAILLLIVSNGRVALENLIKYGILVAPQEWISWAPLDPFRWPTCTTVLCSNVSILAVLCAEIVLSRGYLSNRFAAGFYVVLITTHFTVPAILILHHDGNPLFAVWGLMVIVIEGLKIISYAHVNYWCRLAREEEKSLKKPTTPYSYPNNLTLTNMYYFMFAPTLCYELRFPRTPARRRGFIFKRVIEMITFTFVIVALSEQWVIPLMKNSIAPFSEMDFGRCIERLLKLAIPNHLLWLLGFYTLFHSALNLIAEILRFADREFYLDFWNSETITYFWRSWNIPVHRWAVRHLYKPIVGNGYSKLTASIAVFFVSAFFHEYLVSVPLHMFRLWAFNGMLAQIPLSIVTDRLLHGGRAGNIVVWLSLILGQPMAILMYLHDYAFMKLNGIEE